MSWPMARRISDFVLSLSGNNEDRVIFDFFGGEPLLEIDLVEKICDYLIEQMEKLGHKWLDNYTIRFTTNGLLYSSPKVQKFICKHKKHLSIQISIDGNKLKHDMNRVFPNGTGSYERILPSIKLWTTQFEVPETFKVVSHEDVGSVYESVKHLISLNIKKIFISTVVEDVWKDGDDVIYEQQLMLLADYLIDNHLWDAVNISIFNPDYGKPDTEDHIYPCGNLIYAFDSRGIIYSCMRFAPYSLREKPSRQIGTIDTGINFNKIRALLSIDKESCFPKQCLDCEIQSFCRWCPAEAYDESNSGTVFYRPTTICGLHKAAVRVKNYYWNRINMINSIHNV